MSNKLYYFDIYGRAESIRFLLSAAHVAFEDVKITGEQLAELKAAGKLEFGQVPMFETADGKQLVQSWAILRFLGRTHGYYPEDCETAWRVDSTIDAVEDFFTTYFKACFEKDEEKKKTFTENYIKWLPGWLTAIEKRLAGNSNPNFIVGDKLTIADFALAAVGFNVLLNEASPLYSQTLELILPHEALKAYATNQREIFKEHLAARPTPRPF